MSPFPRDPKRIRERIKRYERELASEKRRFGGYDDSAGKRYLLGPLYLRLGDVDGACKPFAWFQRTFPDDMGEPFHYLCWALALYLAGEHSKATVKLAQTWFRNHYLVERLLGIAVSRPAIEHGSNWEMPEYVAHGPAELLKLWDGDALAWAGAVYGRAWFEEARTEYIEIEQRLTDEPVGPSQGVLLEGCARVKALVGTLTSKGGEFNLDHV
jgi:hypothetical protein